MNKYFTSTLSAICLVTAFAASSAGATDITPESKKVIYADLNLENPAGVQVLYSRIRKAAFQVCEATFSKDLSQREQTHDCIRQAMTAAVAHVNNRELSALYSQKTGYPVASAPVVLASR